MASLVMIVDDHAVIRRMLRAVLEAEDWQVADATNGAEGVRKAQELKPNLIILDLSMPVMNGLEAARVLKLLMPHVPLLLFTNNAGAALKKEAPLCRYRWGGFQGGIRLGAAFGHPREVTARIGRGG